MLNFMLFFFFSDMSGKMFVFPQETNTAHVKLTASKQEFSTVTVCHRLDWMCKMQKNKAVSLTLMKDDEKFCIVLGPTQT